MKRLSQTTRMKPIKKERVMPFLIFGLIALAPATANADMMTTPQAQVVSSVSGTNITAKFRPHPTTKQKLDFEVLDTLLNGTVLFMGPSARKSELRPLAYTGTRVIKKHTSPYRLEGNRVVYSLVNSKIRDLFGEYIQDLQDISNEIDITSLPKNEQLAYWLNLHNAALLYTISESYPVRYPEKIKPISGSDATLHTAKILTVAGTPLSLKDIREKIVFSNWSDPLVAYGFHLGNIGSPGLANHAFTGANVNWQLRQNADWFVNSLKSFDDGRVSRYYYDIAPFYFADFDTDLRAHFQRFMRADIYAETKGFDHFKRQKSLAVIADTTGGYGKFSAPGNTKILTGANSGPLLLSASTREFMKERQEKFQRLQELNLFSYGTVIIEDIDTSDESAEIK